MEYTWSKLQEQKFKLRDMKTYYKNMVAWADPCHSDTHKNNSRVCPAKDLSFIIIYETSGCRILFKTT